MRQAGQTVKRAGLLRRAIFDRTRVTIVLSAALIVGLGFFRSDGTSGTHPRVFWAAKVEWNHCADVVVAGDSRVVDDVAPSHMTGALGDLRIYNFGFMAVSWADEYLDAIERVLDPQSDSKIIVLGVSPPSCLLKGADWNGFLQAKRNADQRSVLDAGPVGEMLLFFEPMSVKDSLRRLAGIDPRHRYMRDYRNDGWVGTRRHRNDTTLSVRGYALQIFPENRADERVISRMLARVQTWSDRGILVCAFRPPTVRAMVRLEDEKSGFDETTFVERFEAAGGVWIDVDQYRYSSHDGSHLSRPGAIEFSRDLADRIAQVRNSRRRP